MLRILFVFIIAFIAINCEVANEYEQCGGLYYSDPKDCAEGFSCESITDYYAICLSPEEAEYYRKSDDDEDSNKALDFNLCGGGDDYKGPTACSDGFKCQALHPLYHICLPFSADSDEVPHYGLCGGANYSGSNKCAGELTCKDIDDLYSICLAEDEEHF